MVLIVLAQSIRATDARLKTSNGPIKGGVYNISHSITLKSSNGPIVADSLFAPAAEVTSSNAPITGSFNVSDSLVLHSSNGPVVVNVTLLNDPARPPTTLRAETSNNIISANISLLSTTSAHGSFDVSARTSNAPLTLGVPAQPADSTLRLRARASNAPAVIALHSAYEGALAAATSRGSPIVRAVDADAPDPRGEGRARSVEFSEVGRGVVRGTVRWVPSKREEGTLGKVEVVTSNGPISLNL